VTLHPPDEPAGHETGLKQQGGPLAKRHGQAEASISADSIGGSVGGLYWRVCRRTLLAGLSADSIGGSASGLLPGLWLPQLNRRVQVRSTADAGGREGPRAEWH
jgi:hypothetical protein